MNSAISYRPDIDGLRAVAVLLVVLFHLGFPVSGGFIGVDVFFVISGYLITAIIVREQDAGAFSLLRFYERRARRILPALYVVLAVSAVAGWFLLFPAEFAYFGETLAGAAAFVSNIIFHQESGYFETDSAFVPLLHTWSLAVEEQFYIFFPLILMAVFKFRRAAQARVVVTLWVISYIFAALALCLEKQDAAFYLLPARAWELLTGSILALNIMPAIRDARTANILSLLGLCMIMAAGFLYSEALPFPGPLALLPVLGAAFVLYGGVQYQGTTARLLGARAPVFIGKISYSLYLWHWPVIAFYQYAAPWPMDYTHAAMLFAASVFLSILSWRFVEQPVRFNAAISRKTLFVFSGIIGVVFICAGLWIAHKGGMPSRFPPEIEKLAQVEIGRELPVIEELTSGYRYIIGDRAARESFIVLGDSHAYAALPAIDNVARQEKKRGYLIGYSGCPPALSPLGETRDDMCVEMIASTAEFLKAHPKAKHVILISYWTAHKRNWEKYKKVYGDDHFAWYMDDLVATLKAQGRKVSIVTEVPLAPAKNPAHYLARAKYYNQPVSLDTPLSDHEARQGAVDEIFERLSQKYGVKVIRPSKTLCEGGRCPLTHDGRSLYYDDDHLSVYGAEHIQRLFAPLF